MRRRSTTRRNGKSVSFVDVDFGTGAAVQGRG